MPSYGEQLGGEVVCPLCRGVASSEAKMSYPLEGDSLPSSEAEVRSAVEGSRRGPSSDAEMSHPLEGRSATLERGGDCSAGLRGVRMGHTLGFFESFPFFRIWKEAGDLCGPSCLNMCLCFRKWS